jgi:carbamoyltransferase
VQTPEQALQTLKRSKGMDGIMMLSAERNVFLVWHNLWGPPKDAGKRLQQWVQDWQSELATKESVFRNKNPVSTIASVGRNGRTNARI